MGYNSKKDYSKAFEDRVNSMEQRAGVPQDGQYWWVVGKVMKKGRIHTVVIGPELDEDGANRLGYETFGGDDYKCVQFKTRSLSAATQMYKARKARKKGVTIENAIERVRHRGSDIGIQ